MKSDFQKIFLVNKKERTFEKTLEDKQNSKKNLHTSVQLIYGVDSFGYVSDTSLTYYFRDGETRVVVTGKRRQGVYTDSYCNIGNTLVVDTNFIVHLVSLQIVWSPTMLVVPFFDLKGTYL